MAKNILVTGGAGYIASHTIIELKNAGYTPIIVDNFVNSSPKIIKLIELLTNSTLKIYRIDLTDRLSLERIFADFVNLNSGECDICAVMHFAGLKSVPESINNPLDYYEVNLKGTLNLFQAMKEFKVKNLIFSSSAAVYGNCSEKDINHSFSERDSILPQNPYANTKAIIERMIEDFSKTGKIKAVSLRYFNPIGAHPSGLLGESPSTLNNLMPIIANLALDTKNNPPLTINGLDYETLDGTCIRDYIHVMDVAIGHVVTLQYLLNNLELGSHEIFNLGTGKGTSVLQALAIFTKVTGVNMPFTFGPRRSGDVPFLVADVSKAKEILGWQSKYSIEEACHDLWKWQCSRK
jgi:UDP-glucose 4-epimerase